MTTFIRKLGWVGIALLIANEIRGVIVVALILLGWWSA